MDAFTFWLGVIYDARQKVCPCSSQQWCTLCNGSSRVFKEAERKEQMPLFEQMQLQAWMDPSSILLLQFWFVAGFSDGTNVTTTESASATVHLTLPNQRSNFELFLLLPALSWLVASLSEATIFVSSFSNWDNSYPASSFRFRRFKRRRHSPLHTLNDTLESESRD